MSRGEDALRRKADTAAAAGRRYVSDVAVEHVREVLAELDELRRQRDAAPRIILGIDPAGNIDPSSLMIGSLPTLYRPAIVGRAPTADDFTIHAPIEPAVLPPDVFHGVRMAGDGATLGERMAATGYASDWYTAEERAKLAAGVAPHPFTNPDGYFSPACTAMVERDGSGDDCGLASGDPLHDDPREGMDFDEPYVEPESWDDRTSPS